MTRKGKIARLPQPIRDQINLRLQNGVEGKQVAEWLNTLPKVQALMTAEFDGQPVNEVNLSNWKLGGFLDWEEQQQALAAARRFASDAAELSRQGGAQLADQLVLCLTARLAAALQAPAYRGDDPAGQLQRLRQLSVDLARLRKGDHNAQWLRIQRGKLDLQSKKYKEEAAARKRELKQLQNPGARAITRELWEELERDLRLM